MTSAPGGRRFTAEEAQSLLEETVRELAERMVRLRREWRPLEARWNRLVVKVGSNGGGLSPTDVEGMRAALEERTVELRGVIDEIRSHGIEIKDLDRGLIDFPAVVDGEEAFLCWEVGEPRIAYWHPRDGGYAGRRPL